MDRQERVKWLKRKGFHKEAELIASITPEQDKAFDDWLSKPPNRARWERALSAALSEQKASNRA